MPFTNSHGSMTGGGGRLGRDYKLTWAEDVGLCSHLRFFRYKRGRGGVILFAFVLAQGRPHLPRLIVLWIRNNRGGFSQSQKYTTNHGYGRRSLVFCPFGRLCDCSHGLATLTYYFYFNRHLGVSCTGELNGKGESPLPPNCHPYGDNLILCWVFRYKRGRGGVKVFAFVHAQGRPHLPRLIVVWIRNNRGGYSQSQKYTTNHGYGRWSLVSCSFGRLWDCSHGLATLMYYFYFNRHLGVSCTGELNGKGESPLPPNCHRYGDSMILSWVKIPSNLYSP
jgi:hypothetical protein